MFQIEASFPPLSRTFFHVYKKRKKKNKKQKLKSTTQFEVMIRRRSTEQRDNQVPVGKASEGEGLTGFTDDTEDLGLEVMEAVGW